MIAILDADDPAYIHEAAKRGVFAYIVDGSPDELQSAIDIIVQRFAEYQSLQGAFGRRATIEQAKGIVMARHAISADAAFEQLRDHSQHNGRKLADVAAAVVESHLQLLPAPQAPPPPGLLITRQAAFQRARCSCPLPGPGNTRSVHLPHAGGRRVTMRVRRNQFGAAGALPAGATSIGSARAPSLSNRVVRLHVDLEPGRRPSDA